MIFQRSCALVAVGLMAGCLQGSEETSIGRIETFGRPIVMDNSSPDFRVTARSDAWTSRTAPAGKYWGRDYLAARAGYETIQNGNRTVQSYPGSADWDFRDLPRGDYRVRAAFPALPQNTRRANYILYLHADGGITSWDFEVDQTRIGSDGFVELVSAERSWQAGGLRRFPLGGEDSLASFQLAAHISEPGDVVADALEVTPVVTTRAGGSCTASGSAAGAACVDEEASEDPLGAGGWSCSPAGDHPYPWLGTPAADEYGRARCAQCDGLDDNGDGCCSTDEEDAAVCECASRGGSMECPGGRRACVEDGCGDSPADEPAPDPEPCDVAACDDLDPCTIDWCDELGCFWEWDDEWCGDDGGDTDECADLGGWADCDGDGFEEACFCDCYDCSE